MKILFYSSRDFERKYLLEANNHVFEIGMTESSLSVSTAVEAEGYDAVSIFTNDDASAPVLEELNRMGVRFIAVRAAGYDNVDLKRATDLDMHVANVPEYSPYAIAEFALALMLALDRQIILANSQVNEGDFRVSRLVGFDLHGKTIGIIGTGKIGGTLAGILSGFGCRLLACDIQEDEQLKSKYGVEYVPLNILCRESDIISLHTCLTTQTKYLINSKLIGQMKEGVMLINTSRGACVNTADVLQALETGRIGYFGADVYEFEKGLFSYDWSGKPINDQLLKKLLAHPNVLLTPHQAFATREALTNIARTTFDNIRAWSNQRRAAHELSPLYVTTGYGDDEEA